MARELNETNRMKNEFLSTVSHELRTPLTAIKGWGETLLSTPNEDVLLQEKGLHVIIKESERLTRLVEELLDFSRMESGNMSIRMEMFDACAVLDEVITVFQARAARESIHLEANLPPFPVQMRGDGNRIKQVFFNILDNAFKYSGAQANVLINAYLPNPQTFTVTVTDTGCGISQADLPHVTEKFYKANTAVRGSGIGLAVVSEIMSLHGGTLHIQSEVGQGTAVTLQFPIPQMTE